MEKKLIQLYIFGVVLFSDYKMFAEAGEDPGEDTEEGDLEDDAEGAPLPINGKLLWLAFTGILFALYMYRKHKDLQKLKQ